MTTLRPASRYLAACAAGLAALAAALAAVGSHALAGRLGPAELASFNTAVSFQFLNAVGLLGAAWVVDRLPGSRLALAAAWLLPAGVLLFCGSIYAARLGWISSPGPTAPIGGSSVILAWALLAVALLRGRG
jgi:uncharacterized membrane protein YgdD (TMEM256/DUF423 family)